MARRSFVENLLNAPADFAKEMKGLASGKKQEAAPASAPQAETPRAVVSPRPDARRAEVLRFPERQAPARPDRAAPAVDRAAADRARQRNFDNARSTIEQLTAQIAGVDARIRGAEAKGDLHAKDTWTQMKKSLDNELKKKRADMERLRGGQVAA